MWLRIYLALFFVVSISLAICCGYLIGSWQTDQAVKRMKSYSYASMINGLNSGDIELSDAVDQVEREIFYGLQEYGKYLESPIKKFGWKGSLLASECKGLDDLMSYWNKYKDKSSVFHKLDLNKWIGLKLVISSYEKDRDECRK